MNLVGLDVAGDADAWATAGFAVDGDGGCRIGHVRVQTAVGDSGIAAWQLAPEAYSTEPATHPNGSTLIDHVVVFTDDPARTTAAYGDIGLDVRRVRDVGNGRTQTFFRAGEVIIELVGPVGSGEQLWGLAVTVADLDACAALLGDRLGRVKDAVQPGRRIATLRHEACGLTVPIAFMS
jgi:hypothetical protein